jgi:predicted Rossmann fold flavoprotein
MNHEKLIVIGGGAAGFFCAVNAARMKPGLQVVIVEKTGKILSKVKISGGGRCNVTNACSDIVEMTRNYPRGASFVKKTFHWFFTADTVKWFGERGVPLVAEADGRMFPVSQSSQTIIDCLLREVNKFGVQLLLNREVKMIERVNNSWQVTLANGELLKANFVCVASGGYPKLSMFGWLQALGHTIEAPVPSLFTFNIPGDPLIRLMGLSVANAGVKITGTKLQEAGPLLVTHWGLSGPVILRLSAWGARELKERAYSFNIMVNWIPAFNEQNLQKKMQEIRREQGAQKITLKNPFDLPQRLWEYLLQQSGIPESTRWADLGVVLQNRLVKHLLMQEFAVKGKTSFKEEFVTAGGIALSEVNATTMMSKLQPGLFFAGEILDVDGITGGYNFQHAWTSGWLAAKNIAGVGVETG